MTNSKTVLQNVKDIKKTIMEKNVNVEVMMLQYRIKRYQSMGNGAMCQALSAKLNKLLDEQPIA